MSAMTFEMLFLSIVRTIARERVYREVNKGLYVVARIFFLLLLNCFAWPCLAVA